MTETPQTATESEFLGHLMRGADLLRGGQLEEARQVTDQALALQPGEPRARNLLGLVHFRLGQLEASREVYQALCADYPADNGFRLNLGLVELRIGEIDEAIGELERVVAAEPDNQRAHGYLGLAYAQVGDAARARDAFQKAGQPELAAEMEARLAATETAFGERAGSADGLLHDEPPPSLEEFGGQVTAIAPDDVLQSAVQASSVPDEEDVDAAFDEMEHGFAAEQTPGPRRTTDVGLGKPLVPAASADAAPAVATPAGPEPAAAPAPALPGPAAPFDLRALAAVCRASAADLEIPAPHDGEAPAAATPPPPEQAATPAAAFVTRGLLYPGEGGAGLAVGPSGALLCRIDGTMILRLEGGVAVTGNLAFEPTFRRVRGRTVDEPLGGDAPLFQVRGAGSILALPPAGTHFVALTLEDDILYVREEVVYGFSDDLHWESGRIPGLASAYPMLQFRGRGALALRLTGTLTPLKLERGQSMGVDAAALFGWVGRVVPHAMSTGGASGRHVGCTGEGVLLLHVPSDGLR